MMHVGGGGDIMMHVEECLVHRRDIMMHVGGYYDACGGYQEYIKRCSVHWGDTMSTVVDIMGTSGDVQYIGRIS